MNALKSIILVFVFSVFCCSVARAQNNFEEGYFINNTGERSEVWINNKGWTSNPESFEYKKTLTASTESENIKTISEFGISEKIRFVRATIEVDKSASGLNSMSEERAPDFVEETVFLKQLVSGEAELYKYSKGSLVRYFFKTKNVDITQLIYKPYRIHNKIAYNENYKQQLINHMSCGGNKKNIEKLNYKERSLIRFFDAYNQCVDPNYSNLLETSNYGKLNLSVRPRVNFQSLSFLNIETNHSYTFDNSVDFGVGVELEYILPTQKNNWAILLEPTLKFYKSEGVGIAENVSGGKLILQADHTTIELPLGVRYYVYLNNRSALFLNAHFMMEMGLSADFEFLRNDGSLYKTLEYKASPSAGFGIGYNYNRKYNVELRYYTTKDVLAHYHFWKSEYDNLTLIIGYNFL